MMAEELALEKERSEEQSDLRKRLHKPIRQWYKTQPELKAECGRFPIFYQDTATWPHWTKVYKAYIVATEDADVASSAAPPTDAAPAEAAAVAAPKKRRSRWSSEPAPVASAAAGDGAEDPPKKRRKSRFGAAPAEPAAGGAAAAGSVDLTTLSAKDLGIIMLRAEIMAASTKLLTVALDAAREAQDPNRAPSPPPQYDMMGRKVNNREQRMRANLLKSMEQLNEKLYKLEPALRPKGMKIVRKVFVDPKREHVGYNFIGLIIGPRGNTHRRMESETGCKISIRGKGSVKEGRNRKSTTGDNEPLHVVITGDDYEKVEVAEKMVRDLLVVQDDATNDLKQKQLRELALINGTLREDEACSVCGEQGHRSYLCPNRNRGFKMANVRCDKCGGQHLTADCTSESRDGLDEEYLSFMHELSGGQPPAARGGGAGIGGAGGAAAGPAAAAPAAGPSSGSYDRVRSAMAYVRAQQLAKGGGGGEANVQKIDGGAVVLTDLGVAPLPPPPPQMQQQQQQQQPMQQQPMQPMQAPPMGGGGYRAPPPGYMQHGMAPPPQQQHWRGPPQMGWGQPGMPPPPHGYGYNGPPAMGAQYHAPPRVPPPPPAARAAPPAVAPAAPAPVAAAASVNADSGSDSSDMEM